MQLKPSFDPNYSDISLPEEPMESFQVNKLITHIFHEGELSLAIYLANQYYLHQYYQDFDLNYTNSVLFKNLSLSDAQEKLNTILLLR